MASPNPTDIAQGEVAAAQAPTYRKKNTGVDNNPGAVNSDAVARAAGLELNTELKVEPGFVDPSIVQIIYHTYDGRVIIVPAYMVPKLLSFRFPSGDSYIPKKYWEQQVWSTRPNTNFIPGSVKCMLHEEQTDEVKAILKACGVPLGRCSKSGIASEFHLNEHMRLKHKSEMKMITEFRTKTDTAEQRDLQRAQLDAILKLAEAASKK